MIRPAPERLELHVTNRHITDGEIGNSEMCAVALAARDALGFKVDNDDMDLWVDQGIHVTYRHPESPEDFITVDYDFTTELEDWVGAFDDGQVMAPIDVIVERGMIESDYDYPEEDELPKDL